MVRTVGNSNYRFPAVARGLAWNGFHPRERKSQAEKAILILCVTLVVNFVDNGFTAVGSYAEAVENIRQQPPSVGPVAEFRQAVIRML